MPKRSIHTLAKKISLIPLFLTAGIVLIAMGSAVYLHEAQVKKLPAPNYVSDAIQLPKEPYHIATVSASTPVEISHVPILMYHYVEHVQNSRDIMRQKLAILPSTLDLQLRTLQAAGYTFMSASELSSVIDEKIPLPKKPVVLTFDDGYADFYENAFPVLEKYQVKATAYIITDFIGKPGYMTLDQLKIIKASNLVEIGAHTEHHIDLNTASVAKQTEEIVGSKIALEEYFPGQVTSFAYPSGRFNSETIQIVKSAGFTNAMSTLPGTEVSTANRLVLFRLRPGSRTGSELVTFLETMSK